ncbi:MAG: proline dehydrogenase family protein [Mycobacterium sp.]
MAFSAVLRPALLAAGRSPRMARTVARVPVTKHVVDRFVAGETEADAVAVARRLLDDGRDITIDYLGEDTTDVAQANDTVRHYLALLPALSQLTEQTPERRRVEVSLKLSALGQALPRDGHQIAVDNARTICRAAESSGAWVTVDAEDHTTTDSTLAIVNELRAEFPTLGTVLQAYLHRTEGDCRDLSGPGSRIRLCKGAYREPVSVAYQNKRDVDGSYLRCLRILMEGTGYPMVATHDPSMIEAALRSAGDAGRSAEKFELQMLYGIRDVEQRRLVGTGHQLRVYLPYGQQWYGYFMRRLAERPANLMFFLRSLSSAK